MMACVGLGVAEITRRFIQEWVHALVKTDVEVLNSCFFIKIKVSAYSDIRMIPLMSTAKILLLTLSLLSNNLRLLQSFEHECQQCHFYISVK